MEQIKVRGKIFNYIVEKDGKYLVGSVPGRRLMYTQGKNKKELKKYMKDVIELVLDYEADEKLNARSWRARMVKIPNARPATS